jgi:hypothetical protein
VAARGLAHNVARIAFAVLAAVAMAYQFAKLNGSPSFSAGNFFSFFTIQSNILAAAMLVAAALVRRSERTGVFDAVRGGVTLYIAITGIVFAVLLSGLQESLDTHIGWVDFVVHKLIPIMVVADWLIDPPRHRLSITTALLWLTYPAIWLAYTLIRGANTDWYPYPFVDANQLGYGGVLWRCAVLLAAFAGAALLCRWIGNVRAQSRHVSAVGV